MKTKSKLRVALAMGVLLSYSSMAQDSTKVNRPHENDTFWFTLQAGYGYFQNGTLNQFLAPGTPSLNTTLGILGLSLLRQHKRWIGGVTLQGGMSQPYTQNNYQGISGQDYQISNGFYNGLIHLGYALVNTDKFKLYPILGIGGGQAILQLTQTNISISNITTHALSSQTSTNAQIYKYVAYFDAGIGADFFLSKKSEEEGRGKKSHGVVLGVKVGYTQGVGMGKWGFNNDNTISDNPSYNPGLFYAKIEVGLFKTGRFGHHGWHKGK
jgi:hypothetical protein